MTAHLTRLTGLWPPFASSSGDAPPAPTTFKAALASYLAADPSLAALLAQPAEPVHPGEDARDCSLAFRVTSRGPGAHLGGDAGFADASVEFTARSATYGVCDQVVAALATLFHGKANYTLSGLSVMRSIAREDDDDYSDGGDAADEGTFSDSVTIDFRYRTR